MSQNKIWMVDCAIFLTMTATLLSLAWLYWGDAAYIDFSEGYGNAIYQNGGNTFDGNKIAEFGTLE